MSLPSHVQRRRLRLPENGVEIALLDWGGDGPLALLHHANGFCGALFEPIAESLASHFRVVAMDARGHGDSSSASGPEAYHWRRFPEDILGVARALAPEAPDGRVALAIGHSFGGTSMIAAAGIEPGLFERVVAIDPVVVPPEFARGDAATSRSRALEEGARKRRAIFASRDEARSRWQGRGFFAHWQPRALELYVEEGLRDRGDGTVELKCAPEVEAAVFSGSGGFDVFALAGGVRAPVLILWASRASFPRPVHEMLAARIADARIEDLDAGHLVTMENPALVSRAVLRFVDETRAQERSIS